MDREKEEKEEMILMESFSKHMMQRLKANRDKGTWLDYTRLELCSLLLQEVHELIEAMTFTHVSPLQSIVHEASDVACVAAFIADNFGSRSFNG